MVDHTLNRNQLGSSKSSRIFSNLAQLGAVLLGLILVALSSLLLMAQIPTGGLAVLDTLGLRQPVFELLSVVAYVTLIGLVIRLYIVYFRPRLLVQPRYVWLLSLLLLLFVGLARLMIPGYNLWPYLFPMATLSIMLAVLIEAQFSMLVTMLVGSIAGYIGHGSLELTVYLMMGGLIGILTMGRTKGVNRWLWSGAYVALSNVIVVLIFHLPQSNFDPVSLSELMAIGITNGALSASLALIGFFLVGNLLGITTSLQLLDLAQPTQPLLQRLLTGAPGTYHHSLLVGNLAEQAAERIGADALLSRVGAYYHDVGKLAYPHFFIENQLQQAEVEPDQLDPRDSARLIINHVTDGLKLAKKYGLPRDVRAFIAEHHGTSLVKYFYHQALEQAADPTQVAEADFRYPGPRPQRKETAIVMLADSCEAAVRSIQPASVTELEQLVHRIITDKIAAGELDESDLTLRDVELIQITFVEILQGLFHPRIVYPLEESQEELTGPDSAILSTSGPVLITTPSSVRPEVTL